MCVNSLYLQHGIYNVFSGFSTLVGGHYVEALGLSAAGELGLDGFFMVVGL